MLRTARAAGLALLLVTTALSGAAYAQAPQAKATALPAKV